MVREHSLRDTESQKNHGENCDVCAHTHVQMHQACLATQRACVEQCLIGHCTEKQSTVGIISEPAHAISSEHMRMTYAPEGSMPVHDGYALPDDDIAQQWRKAHNTGQRGASKQRESRSIIHLQASSHVADTRAVAVRTCKDNHLPKTSNQRSVIARCASVYADTQPAASLHSTTYWEATTVC